MNKIIREGLRFFLPADKTFWKLYAPVIRILKDSHEHLLIRQKINTYFELGKQDRVLEEGCGKAVWLSEVRAQVGLAVGLDIEMGMLKNASGAHLVRADLNAGMPFEDGAFSKVGSILVEGYLRERDLALQERYRVLSPGGMLAIITPRKGAKFFKVLAAEAKLRKAEQTIVDNLKRLPLAIIAVLFGKIAEMKAIAGDWHFYEKEELIDKYRRAGFEIVACESVYAEQAWLLVARKPVL